jgi:O-methyltransferase
MKKILHKTLAKLGYRVRNIMVDIDMDQDLDFIEKVNLVREFTMTSKESMKALYDAVNYVSKHQIKGDIVECGVWRGGSSMLGALTLLSNNDQDRNLYLYDTFEGMNAPTESDISVNGEPASETWQGKFKCFADYNDVKSNMTKTNYPIDKIKLIKGMVEDTIPNIIPEKISILRLDTDWYESTYHELVNLYPKLVIGGILIIDDYGFWKGSRKAVDQYFEENNIPIYLNRVDYTVRSAIKIK